MNLNRRPKRLVDGGMLSWLYGSSPQGVSAWSLEKLRFRDDLIVLDSRRSYREEYWAGYKANRREADLTMDKEIQVEMVRRFRKELAGDWLLQTVQVDGLEADDIVSLLALQFGGLDLLGVDKDYLQLPVPVVMTELNGNRQSLARYRSHLPKTCQPYVNKDVDVLFTLALLGDPVDNIPRLVPPRKLAEYAYIMADSRLGVRNERALEAYGEDFARNIYLAILPGPWVYQPCLTPGEVLEALAEGSYYDQEVRPDIRVEVLSSYYARLDFDAFLLPLSLIGGRGLPRFSIKSRVKTFKYIDKSI